MANKTLIAEAGNLKMWVLHKDHGGAHVHIMAPGAHAKIYADGTVERSKGFSEIALNRLQRWVRDNAAQIKEEWEKIYGEK